MNPPPASRTEGTVDADRQARFARIEDWFHRLSSLPAADWATVLQASEPDPETRFETLRLLSCSEGSIHPLDALVSMPLPEARLGRVIGDWKLVRELGRGGMGTVFEAERIDGLFEARVAIKMLHAFPSDASQDRLRRERQVLATLDHPHIAHLLDGGETEDGQPYLVMERVPGVSLTAWMRANEPDLDMRLRLFERLVSAVAHAHQRLVIHRDIKPSNVLVREDGQPKLLDFGVARLMEPAAPMPAGERSTRIFTPGYASPEQMQGEVVTTAADIFSLGVLLGELLTGLQPAMPAEAPPQWRPVRIDAELRGIIAHASASEPAARYASADALLEDIERWRRGQPLRAAPDRAWYRLRKFMGRHRFASAAVGLVLVAALIVGWRIQNERDRALEAESRARAALARQQEQHRFLSSFFAGVGQRDAEGRLLDGLRLLDRARDALTQREAGADAAGIELLLANAYLHAQRYADAAALYEQGLQRDARDMAPLDQAGAMRDWARALVQMRDTDRALDVLRRALALLPSSSSGIEDAELRARLHITRIQALRQRAQATRAGDHAHVAQEIDAALAHAARHLPENHVLRGTLLMEKALSLELAGRVQDLVKVRREALAVWENDPAAFPQDLASQRLNLARALRLANQSGPEPDRLLDEVQPVFEWHYGASGLATVQIERARLALSRADVPSATAAFEQAQSLRDHAHAEPDLRVSLLGVELTLARGDIARAQSQLDDAATLARTDVDRSRIRALQDRIVATRSE